MQGYHLSLTCNVTCTGIDHLKTPLPLLFPYTHMRLLQGPVDAKAEFNAGIRAMEGGEWEEAGAHFRATLHASKDAKQVESSAFYLAAVLLLDAQVNNLLESYTKQAYASWVSPSLTFFGAS